MASLRYSPSVQAIGGDKLSEEINIEKVGPLRRVELRARLNIQNGYEFAKVEQLCSLRAYEG